MSPDGRCNENLLSIRAPLAGTDFHFLNQFIGFPEANGPCSFRGGFFGGAIQRERVSLLSLLSGALFPPWLMETASWADPPLLVRPGRVFAKNFFGLLSSPAQHKTHQLFPAAGAGGEANPAVNPFPTKPRRAGARHPQGRGEALRGSSLFLKKQDLLSFGTKLKANLFSSSSLLVTTQIAAQKKKSC